MTIREIKIQHNSTSSPTTPSGWVDAGAGNSTGVKSSNMDGSGFGYEVLTAFQSAGNVSSTFDNPDHGIPIDVWRRSWSASTSINTGAKFFGLPVGLPVEIDFFGASTAAGRNRVLVVDGVSYENLQPDSLTTPLTPNAPTTATAIADENGEIAIIFGSSGGGGPATFSGLILRYDDAWSPDPDDPTIMPDGTDALIENGGTHQIAFASLVSPPSSVAIVYDDGVNAPVVTPQTGFIYTEDEEDETRGIASYTGVRGAVPYTDDTYPSARYSLLVTCEDDSEIEFGPIVLQQQDNWQFVTAVDPYNDDSSIIPVWESGGAVTGDQIDWPATVGNIAPTILPNFTHRGDRIDPEIPYPESITFTINYWDSVDHVRYAVTVEVAYDEDGGGVVIGIVSINAGDPVVAGETFPVVLAGINANDVTAIALQNGSDYYACPVVEVTNSTTLTAVAPGNLPSGLSLTAKAFESKHARSVRELISGIPAQLVAIDEAVEDAQTAAAAALEAKEAAEIAAETAGKSAYEIAVEFDEFEGDEEAWLASLVGPQGATGDTGATGATGEKGDAGVGISIKGNVATTGDLPGGATEGDAYTVDADGHLWVWSGSAWVDAGLIVGPPGKSAYEVAVDEGFIGNEAAWLESLKAPLGFATDDVRVFTSADQVSNNIAVTLDCSANNYFMLNFNGSPTPSTSGTYFVTLANIPTGSNTGYTFHAEIDRGGRKAGKVVFILPDGMTAEWPATPTYGSASGDWDLVQGYWRPSKPDKLRMSLVDGHRV